MKLKLTDELKNYLTIDELDSYYKLTDFIQRNAMIELALGRKLRSQRVKLKDN